MKNKPITTFSKSKFVFITTIFCLASNLSIAAAEGDAAEVGAAEKLSKSRHRVPSSDTVKEGSAQSFKSPRTDSSGSVGSTAEAGAAEYTEEIEKALVSGDSKWAAQACQKADRFFAKLAMTDPAALVRYVSGSSS